MASDDVTVPSEFANLGPSQKSSFSNLPCCNEEVAAPAILLQQSRDARGGTPPPIVKRQEKGERRCTGLKQVVRPMRLVASDLSNRSQVRRKFSAAQLISRGARPRETARIPVVTLDYIMVQKANDSHRAPFLARDFHCRYFVSQGCPQTVESLPLMSIGLAVPLNISTNFRWMLSKFSSTTRCWITM
jgi:hypothetical protein